MTEGPHTRARAMEEHLTAVLTKLDALTDTIAIHESRLSKIDTLADNVAAYQTVMADIVVKISKLETCPPPQPALLPLPQSPIPGVALQPHSGAIHTTNPPPQPALLPLPQSPLPVFPLQPHSEALTTTNPPSFPFARLPKLEIPLFSGDRVRDWIFQIELFFAYHQSLRALLHQTIQTPEQQQWVTKLLGFDFDIVHKPGVANGPADALSRLPPAMCSTLTASSVPIAAIWEALRHSYKTSSTSSELFQDVLCCPEKHQHFSVRDGLLFFKGRAYVPPETALHQLLLTEFHKSPLGGHAGEQRTFARIASIFYWPGLRRAVREFVAACHACQSVKPFTKAPQGLLQPLPIPGKVWDSISMDFITHLPPSAGKTTIFVVVDRLSKQGHFSALGPSFTAPQVAETFIKDVVKLHGVPSSIVSDRDPLFMSSFWRELFKQQGTVLAMSSAYHPQTDGQTEVLNRYLEDYLRCFVADQPRQWLRYLPWAEWHYNTAWHSAIRMTPYEAVFGRPPPSLLDYVEGSTSVAAVDDLLTERSQILVTLRSNLLRAQNRMASHANAHRTDISFQVGDWVFLKLQPYRQSSITTHRRTTKLSRRFYGPFRISKRIGAVAYRLELPSTSRIHNVFHVSNLKLCRGDPPAQQFSLPERFIDQQPIIHPSQILNTRSILRQGHHIQQYLIQWDHRPIEEATWEDASTLRAEFPEFHLEDKVNFGGGTTDTLKEKAGMIKHGEGETSISQNGEIPRKRSSSRVGRKPAHLTDFVT